MYQINHDTFKQLWNEHFKPLVYLCRKKNVGQYGEDIVCDKFVKLWEQRDQFKEPLKVKAFLYISVMNAIRNQWKRSKTVELDFDVEQEAVLGEIETAILSEIYKEIENLPSACKAVFKKRVFEFKSYKEIMEELNIKFNSVDSHYQRARTLLRKRIRYEI